jgi:radical SAM protein with 4Fe4S-binding SPASM domain
LNNESKAYFREVWDFPMMIVISYVYICNAKCPNCPYNNSEIRKDYKDALFMSKEVFRKIADECGPYHSLIRLSGGGEPMLHPNAVEDIIYAKERGAKIGLITNGSRFTEEGLKKIITAQVDAIEFSVDAGDANTYAKARPGLDWQVLNDNVKMAVKVRNELKSKTSIVASIINQDFVDVDSAEKYWKRIVDNVQIRKFLTWGYNEDHSADATPYLPPEDMVPCPWLFERLNIDSRGDVTLCGEDIAFKEKFANIFNNSIKDIWNGEHFNYLREKHLTGKGNEIGICSTCPDWQYRSWQHNYWKLLKNAEKNRSEMQS